MKFEWANLWRWADDVARHASEKIIATYAPNSAFYIESMKRGLDVMRRRMLERMRAQAAASSESSMPDGGGAQRRSDVSSALVTAMVGVVQQSNQVIGELRAKIGSMSPKDVLTVAAEGAPELIGNGNAEALKSGSVRQKTQDALGLRQ